MQQIRDPTFDKNVFQAWLSDENREAIRKLAKQIRGQSGNPE